VTIRALALAVALALIVVAVMALMSVGRTHFQDQLEPRNVIRDLPLDEVGEP
jgi:hypothetical protein